MPRMMSIKLIPPPVDMPIVAPRGSMGRSSAWLVGVMGEGDAGGLAEEGDALEIVADCVLTELKMVTVIV